MGATINMCVVTHQEQKIVYLRVCYTYRGMTERGSARAFPERLDIARNHVMFSPCVSHNIDRPPFNSMTITLLNGCQIGKKPLVTRSYPASDR
jgi:hypothetical protein